MGRSRSSICACGMMCKRPAEVVARMQKNAQRFTNNGSYVAETDPVRHDIRRTAADVKLTHKLAGMLDLQLSALCPKCFYIVSEWEMAAA